jgi:hypothetical protein
MNLDRLPQDFDPESIARIYEHLLEKLDDPERERVLQTALKHPGLYLRKADSGLLEMYLIVGDDEVVSVGVFPTRFLLQPAIHTES